MKCASRFSTHFELVPKSHSILHIIQKTLSLFLIPNLLFHGFLLFLRQFDLHWFRILVLDESETTRERHKVLLQHLLLCAELCTDFFLNCFLKRNQLHLHLSHLDIDLLLDISGHRSQVIHEDVQVCGPNYGELGLWPTGVVVDVEVSPVQPNSLGSCLHGRDGFGVECGRAGVNHSTTITIPGIIASAVINKGVVVRLGINHKPVILVVQHDIVVVVKHRRILGVLLKGLEVGALVESAVVLLHPPVELDVHLAGLWSSEVVNLAVKDIEELVLPRSDVPPPVEEVRGELLYQVLLLGDLDDSGVWDLRNTLVLGNCAGVERPDGFVAV
mmetsp:Transcript_8435/g.11380  ORF Transcript_8435/g.11380 Transcript_8435/m.11380 type:complete len:330 (+) Transcript_8435:126-1115(+)